jgi:hypothetical protein
MTRAAGPSEAALTRAIRALLRQHGCWEIKVLGGLGQRPGVPDLLVCCRGRLMLNGGFARDS